MWRERKRGQITVVSVKGAGMTYILEVKEGRILLQMQREHG